MVADSHPILRNSLDAECTKHLVSALCSPARKQSPGVPLPLPQVSGDFSLVYHIPKELLRAVFHCRHSLSIVRPTIWGSGPCSPFQQLQPTLGAAELTSPSHRGTGSLPGSQPALSQEIDPGLLLWRISSLFCLLFTVRQEEECLSPRSLSESFSWALKCYWQGWVFFAYTS